jgi:pyruvate, orthophosphate dikinase
MISFFDSPHSGSDAEIAARIGGKGLSLWLMTSKLGLPVPPGFTIEAGATQVEPAQVRSAVAKLETHTGLRFGDPVSPLFLSVRSGAPVSMPGMMDTILNVGLTPAVMSAIADQDFAADSHAAFRAGFDKAVPDHVDFDDPYAVLEAAISVVFGSWDSPRAKSYREREGISAELGTAVTVQAMVFGNVCDQSGTGVAFSRNPSTGDPNPAGDWLARAQGEAVVAGTHNTQDLNALAALHPDAHTELIAAMARLEAHYRDMVDVEFTIERGKLWILQARRGKRSPAAAARIAVDLAVGGILNRAEALAIVPVGVRDGSIRLTRRSGDAVPIAHGLGVSPGLVTGHVALDCDAAIDMVDAGKDVILVRSETSPEDVHGMGVSLGILTATGGAVSHAALVAREWGIAAVCGASIGIAGDHFTAGPLRIRGGDLISIDGSSGEVFLGAVSGEAVDDPHVAILQNWANEA